MPILCHHQGLVTCDEGTVQSRPLLAWGGTQQDILPSQSCSWQLRQILRRRVRF